MHMFRGAGCLSCAEDGERSMSWAASRSEFTTLKQRRSCDALLKALIHTRQLCRRFGLGLKLTQHRPGGCDAMILGNSAVPSFCAVQRPPEAVENLQTKQATGMQDQTSTSTANSDRLGVVCTSRGSKRRAGRKLCGGCLRKHSYGYARGTGKVPRLIRNVGSITSGAVFNLQSCVLVRMRKLVFMACGSVCAPEDPCLRGGTR